MGKGATKVSHKINIYEYIAMLLCTRCIKNSNLRKEVARDAIKSKETSSQFESLIEIAM